MINTLLIANRGEIACRVIHTAAAMGVRTVAVYSEADAQALHVEMADEAVAIGPAPAAESYLVVGRIIEAAKATGADAIHPGYGFLSENAVFADACVEAGIIFVGPPAAAIRAMGLKDGAKALMEKAGVPVVPGYHGERQDPDFLKQKAYETGYPVLIKAVAGGGGKGMRRVDKAIQFDEALAGAVREAENAFGDARVLIEKFVSAPRHIEIQVMADSHGNAVHLFERDCSLQRRHQKVIEEAPAPGMTPALRARMGAAAVEAAKAVDYAGAGTVEFIVDGSEPLSDETPFYFMEMNTRLQVEHPVTEAITGLDLVEIQLRVAAGEALPIAQDDLTISGHAVEARLYAEDPDHGFLPSTGRLEALDLAMPEGIRIDTGVRDGDMVTAFYDPMIAKVIAHGATRDAALDRLSGALRDSIVAGPKTNTALLRALADAPDFRAGRFDTGFIDRNLDTLLPDPAPLRRSAAALAALEFVAPSRRGTDPWDAADAFQLGGPRTHGIPVAVDSEVQTVTLTWTPDGPTALSQGQEGGPETVGEVTYVDSDDGLYVILGGRQFFATRPDFHSDDLATDAADTVMAPMHGRVTALAVEVGQAVSRGDRVAVVEAMKMEHTVTAPRDGIVEAVRADVGDQVEEGVVLVRLASELDAEIAPDDATAALV